jgi:hypothetical protein
MMEAVQKFSTFSDLKNAEEVAEKPIDSKEIKHFLELLRAGKTAVDNTSK